MPFARQFEIEVKTGGFLKSDYTLAKDDRNAIRHAYDRNRTGTPKGKCANA